MNLRQRLLKASIVSAPAFALNIVMRIWVEFHPGDDMAVGIYILLPLMILSLPWSFIFVLAHPLQSMGVPLPVLNFLGAIFFFLIVVSNISWLIKIYSYEKVRNWLWSIAGIQSVFALLIVAS